MARPFQPCDFGRYQLTERIAIGGMAEIFYSKVFGAMGFEKAVVIKRILPQFAEDADFLRMFITEAKLVCHLEHPNIVQVHELGENESQYYIAMEFVNGIDARHLWRALAKRRQRLPGVLALFIVAEFLKGLDYAHRAVGPDGQLLGVVHRDVSPSNILISFRGDVKIGDFGIALVQQESKTQAGVLKGKFGYMSPEQVAGLNVDHRSDIFAAGIVLAELLLGRRLFLGSSDFETLDKVMNVRLDVLEEHESALSPEAVRIVRQALMRDVNDRYQSAREFYEDINEHLYQQGHRISNETLAAFIAEHVSPFLEPYKGSENSSSISSPVIHPGQAVRSSSGQHRAPMVSSQIIPDAVEPVSPKITIEEPAPDELQHLPSQSGEIMGDDQVPRRRSQSSQELARISLKKAPVEPAAEPPVIVDESMVDDFIGEEFPTEEPFPAEAPAQAGPDPAHAAPEPPGPPAYIDLPDEEEAPKGTDIPMDHPAFGSMPMLEIGEEEPSDLDLDVPQPEKRPGSMADLSYSPMEGAGEEFELDDEVEDDYRAPGDVLAGLEQASVLLDGQLAGVEGEQGVVADRGEADFTGMLSTRTVTKVLFRFCVVEETGLLVLTGPKVSGRQAELMEWLHGIQVRAGATITSSNSDTRTCEIHLEAGQPHLASADRSEEALLAYLMRIDELSQHRVEMAIKTNPQRRPIAALLASGSLAPLQVSRHVTSFVLETVIETFWWTDGNFAFYRDMESSDESFPTGLDAMQLLAKGVTQLPEEFLDGYFSQLTGQNVVANRTPPTRIERFEPGELMLELYRMLGTSQSMESLVSAGTGVGDPTQVKQNLYLLIECELAVLV